MWKTLKYVRNVLLALVRLAGAALWLHKTGDHGYWLNLLVALDELGNALTGGDPGETISSRAAKARNEGREWGCLLCRLLDWIQNDHCKDALNPDAGKDAVVPD